jgi:uncharacterized RDD family membrane protein YckC
MNETFFCNKCGAQNTAEAQFCSRCGAPTHPTPVVAPPTGSASFTPPYSSPGTSYRAVATVAATGYGGFWIRLVAFMIDAIVVRVVVAPIGMIFGLLGFAGGMMHGVPHFGMTLLGGGVTAILAIFGSWLYEAFMESSSYQATLGKIIFGMKVTDLYGNRISFERATGRHFAKWLSGLILCIGYIMVGVTERKQGLHDLLAGTLVRRT